MGRNVGQRGLPPTGATKVAPYCSARRSACYNAAERLMNLPNALTVTRIFLVPLLVVVLLTKFEGHALVGVPTPLVAPRFSALPR